MEINIKKVSKFVIPLIIIAGFVFNHYRVQNNMIHFIEKEALILDSSLSKSPNNHLLNLGADDFIAHINILKNSSSSTLDDYMISVNTYLFIKNGHLSESEKEKVKDSFNLSYPLGSIEENMRFENLLKISSSDILSNIEAKKIIQSNKAMAESKLEQMKLYSKKINES